MTTSVLDPVTQHRVRQTADALASEFAGALGQAEGRIVKEVPEVLFVCVQNAGRSQMAAGLLSYRAAGKV
ncbi:MAG TPA: hypothetical protein VD769_00735, partial [Gaiellaceae bacterium]|nr:hypothetical protein [Gaiellaceae bacterium]